MKNITSRWRDRQIQGLKFDDQVILRQEKVMLDFIKSCPNYTRWKWRGNDSNFKSICQRQFILDDVNYDGIILFGSIFYSLTTSQLVDTIRQVTDSVDFAYIGINRYELSSHDIDIDLPNDLGDSLDLIMQYCDSNIKRLYNFDTVDGNHMVAAHPMDCYSLCR